jgi:lambda family phage portal protein
MNFLDRAIFAVSPEWGLKRMAAREALRNYDAASLGRRTKNWRTPLTDANTEIKSAHAQLRTRAHDLARNNPYTSKAVSTIVNNVVGTGIRPAFSGKDTIPLKKAFDDWAKNKKADYTNIKNFYGLQRLICRAMAEGGECFIVKKINKKNKHPLELMVLEAEYLYDLDPYQTFNDGSYQEQGITFKNGKRTKYKFYKNHPNGIYNTLDTIEVDAKDVIHCFVQERPGQIRGVPFGVSAFIRTRDFDDYEAAQLMRLKIAACFSVFVTDSSAASFMTGNQAAIDLVSEVQPGMVEYLPPGKSVSFASPPPADGYDIYSRKVQEGIAAGFKVPYIAMTGDFSNVNYSSARMAYMDFLPEIEMLQQDILIPMCVDVIDWFIELIALKGVNISDYNVEWTTPRRAMIDPTKEIPAYTTAVRSGMMSLSESIRQMGYDPELVFNEIAEDNKVLDKLGLVLDSDPRKTMKAGVLQAGFETATDAASYS